MYKIIIYKILLTICIFLSRLPADLEQKLKRLECPFNWVKVLTDDDLHVVEHDFHDKLRRKVDASNDDDFVEFG